MRVIEVVVTPTGETQVQTRGFAGGSCLEASRFLEEALGVAARDQKTPEFYESETVHQQQETQG